MTDGRVFTIELPMRMKINKGGDLESLNLNVYRNLHFYKLNHQKKAFHDHVKPLLSGLPPMEAVKLHYEINPKGGSRLDTMNVGSIVDKFFSDALVLNGIVPDDDYKHVVGNSFSFGSLHPNNPHVLVTITETKPRKETPMRILLDQTEIQTALEAFVQTMGLAGATGVELSLVGDEIQAEIIMNGVLSRPTTVTHPSTETTSDQPRKRGGRVPGSKNKPKENTNVAATSEAGNDLYGSGDSEAGEDEDPDQSTEGEDEAESPKPTTTGKSLFDSDDEDDGTGSQESSGRIDKRGNPSGVSDSESSEDTDPDDEGSDTEAEAAPVTTGRKRPSIFDAD
jgi:hypothetical protein